MQIKIEIDLKPEELRRILGLPDVTGLQDDVVRFLREKVAAAGETFDPTAVIQGSFDLIRRTPAWRKLRDVLAPGDDEAETLIAEASAAQADAEPATTSKPSRRRAARKTAATKAPRKRAGKKKAASPDAES